jgi:elongation factor Ts
MHVAASNPRYLNVASVPADVVSKERDILTEQAQNEAKGKPPEILAKMVEGRLRKSLAEITLSGQPFVKDPDTSIEKLLKGANASVTAFERFEVGAGIEKKQEDFAAEVMAQVKSSTPKPNDPNEPTKH